MSSASIVEPAQHAATRGSLLKAFATFDKDEDGFLTKAEVTSILTRPVKNGEATVVDAFFLKLEANSLDVDHINIDDLIDELIPGDESPNRTKSGSPSRNKRRIVRSTSTTGSSMRRTSTSSSPSFIRTVSRRASAEAAQALSRARDSLSEASSFISRSFSRKSFKRKMAAGKARAERAAATARAAAALATGAAAKAAHAAAVPANRAREDRQGRDDLGESSSFVQLAARRAQAVRVAAAAAANAALEAQRVVKVALRAAMLAESKKGGKEADTAASIAERAAASAQAAAATAEKATMTMNRARYGGSSMGTPGRSTGLTRGQPRAGRTVV